MTDNDSLKQYNDFCRNLVEGYILYNIDSTNSWGEYLLVGEKFPINISTEKTYAVLLFGLKRKDNKFVFNNTKVKLTPDCAGNIPFLKYIGKCTCTTLPDMENVNVNIGLAVAYGNIDLHKYAERLSIRKPKKKKYANDGKPYDRGC